MRSHPDQTNLFPSWTRARNTDPGTSFQAAAKIMPRLNTLQMTVLDHFRAIYPRTSTDLELQEYFGNHLSTYRTRRQELTAMGLIKDSGRVIRQRGHNRIRWIAADWESPNGRREAPT